MANPESGVPVSLFSSPSTSKNSYALALEELPNVERKEDILTTCKVINISTCVLVSGIFKQLKTVVDVPCCLNGLSRI